MVDAGVWFCCFACASADARARTSPSAEGKFVDRSCTAAPSTEARCFFSGLPTVGSSVKARDIRLATESGSSLVPWELSVGVSSPAAGVVLGDFLGWLMLSGSAECCRFSCSNVSQSHISSQVTLGWRSVIGIPESYQYQLAALP